MFTRLNVIRYSAIFFAGQAVGDLIFGAYRHNFAQLGLAFVFLGLTWAYREMYLGWDEEEKTWNFVQRPE